MRRTRPSAAISSNNGHALETTIHSDRNSVSVRCIGRGLLGFNLVPHSAARGGEGRAIRLDPVQGGEWKEESPEDASNGVDDARKLTNEFQNE